MHCNSAVNVSEPLKRMGEPPNEFAVSFSIRLTSLNNKFAKQLMKTEGSVSNARE